MDRRRLRRRVLPRPPRSPCPSWCSTGHERLGAAVAQMILRVWPLPALPDDLPVELVGIPLGKFHGRKPRGTGTLMQAGCRACAVTVAPLRRHALRIRGPGSPGPLKGLGGEFTGAHPVFPRRALRDDQGPTVDGFGAWTQPYRTCRADAEDGHGTSPLPGRADADGGTWHRSAATGSGGLRSAERRMRPTCLAPARGG